MISGITVIDVERSFAKGGFVFYGRSDALLNPGGVRIGTAEIYQQVNAIEGIVDSIAVGKEIERNEQIWLFVQTFCFWCHFR